LTTLAGPIAAVEGTANAQGNLTIAWTDPKGVSQTLLVAGDRRVTSADAIQVSLDSSFARVSAADSQLLTARVAGTANRSVRWSLAVAPGAPPAATAGGISATGVYTAPAGIAKPYAVIVTAQSQADPSSSAIGVVALQPRIQNALAASGGGGLTLAVKSPATVLASLGH
jgi:hypothetical protein